MTYCIVVQVYYYIASIFVNAGTKLLQYNAHHKVDLSGLVIAFRLTLKLHV